MKQEEIEFYRRRLGLEELIQQTSLDTPEARERFKGVGVIQILPTVPR